MFGEKIVPVCTTLPLYPYTTLFRSPPGQPEALKVTTPASQRLSPVVDGAAGTPETVPVTCALGPSQLLLFEIGRASCRERLMFGEQLAPVCTTYPFESESSPVSVQT